MNEAKFGNEMDDNILINIHEGMTVYDRDGEKLGTVDRVYLGTVSEEGQNWGKGPADTTTADAPGYADDPGEVFGMSGEDPAAIDFAFGGGISPSETSGSEIRELLLRHGYIRIKSSGLFASDRYVMPDRIDSVSGERVRLNLSKDELKDR
jgi:hypothetical protein